MLTEIFIMQLNNLWLINHVNLQLIKIKIMNISKLILIKIYENMFSRQTKKVKLNRKIINNDFWNI